jgi:hypothetical protein
MNDNSLQNVNKIHGSNGNAIEFKNDLNMDGNRIGDLGNPVNPQEAATKSYVDQNSGGLIFTGTYTNSSYGEDTSYEPSAQATTSLSCEDPESFIVAQAKGSDSYSNDGPGAYLQSVNTNPMSYGLNWESRPQEDSATNSGTAYGGEYGVAQIEVGLKIVCGKYM